jgi:hypothetical protein
MGEKFKSLSEQEIKELDQYYISVSGTKKKSYSSGMTYEKVLRHKNKKAVIPIRFGKFKLEFSSGKKLQANNAELVHLLNTEWREEITLEIGSDLYKKTGHIFFIRNLTFSHGSIEVEGALFLLVGIMGYPTFSKVAEKVLSGIIVKKFDPVVRRREYKKLISKIEKLIEASISNSAKKVIDVASHNFVIADEKEDAYKKVKFNLVSSDLDNLRNQIQLSIDDYHKRVGF